MTFINWQGYIFAVAGRLQLKNEILETNKLVFLKNVW